MSAAAVLARYQALYGQLLQRTPDAVAALWNDAGGLTDSDAEAFLARALPIMQGAQAATARLVEGYLSQLRREIIGTPIPGSTPIDEMTGAAIRNGVDMATVYLRPIVEARTTISRGGTFIDAMAAARQRARTLAATDISLTQRRATTATLSRDRAVAGYRRVLTGSSCMFCAAASTQRYRAGDLMPIHGHCDCRVAPIYGNTDPGHIANKNVLRNLKAQGPEYWKKSGFVDIDGNPIEPGSESTPTAVRDHGELGPVLANSHHKFTGPADIAA